MTQNFEILLKNKPMEFLPIDQANFHQVAAIYKSGMDTGNATFETTVPSYEAWDKSHLPFGRIAAVAGSTMLGWTALSKVSDRCVYGGVAEVSIYIAPERQGKGLGRILLQKLIEVSEQNGIWTLQCGIMRENEASIQLHLKCGFRLIGYREKVGKLGDVWRDNVIMERRSMVVGV
jgi:L-amino acid N-acyltransferase YncA